MQCYRYQYNFTCLSRQFLMNFDRKLLRLFARIDIMESAEELEMALMQFAPIQLEGMHIAPEGMHIALEGMH